MKNLFITAAIVALTVTPVTAQTVFGNNTNNNSNATAGAVAGASNTNNISNTNANLNSNTASSNQGQLQGQAQGQTQASTSSVNNSVSQSYRSAASSAVAPSIGGGNCNVGFGIGLSEFTGSVSTGISWQNIPCVVLQEAGAFYAMGMKTEAIAHLAAYHKRMGSTLRQTGAVVAPVEAEVATRSVSSASVTFVNQAGDR